MTAPECFINTWHPWDTKAVDVPDVDLTQPRQHVTRDGADCFIATNDLMIEATQ